jgi:tRNA threonylcarbamoyladenosine biosynthesis protein TsaB
MTTAALLAFDTSTERMAVAVQGPGPACWADEPGGAAASAALLPCIHDLLGRAGLAAADLQAVAFGRGPGAFTGLRTSCAVAQGLAFGLGVPVLPIDSLLIVAEVARLQQAAVDAPFDVGVAMDARMEQVYAAVYRWEQGGWRTLDAPALHGLAALGAAWADRVLHCIAGSAPAAFGDRLSLPAAPIVAAEAGRAAALLRLAQAAWSAGEAVDAAQALPLYVRDKVALTTAEREAAR